jgi:hypothetical protein
MAEFGYESKSSRFLHEWGPAIMLAVSGLIMIAIMEADIRRVDADHLVATAQYNVLNERIKRLESIADSGIIPRTEARITAAEAVLRDDDSRLDYLEQQHAPKTNRR